MFTKILVPIDISYDTSDWQKPALTMANQLAHVSGATIHALTIVPSNLLSGYYPNVQISDVTQEAKKKLENIVRSGISDDVTVTLGVESGGICAETLRVARELPADLIVMTSHGPVTMDYLLGSNASHITLHAECSVFVVRERATATKQKFMADALNGL